MNDESPVAPPSGSVVFVRTDATTSGTWRPAFGSEGYRLAADGVADPSYGSTVVTGGIVYTWANPSSDARALSSAVSPGVRNASTWYSSTDFTIDVTVNGAQTRQVAVYCVDFENAGRSQRMEVLDSNTGAVLNTQQLTNFGNGAYVVWNISGSVKIRLTNTAGQFNAVASGIFFGPGVNVGVSVAPATVTLGEAQTQQFTATVTGTSNQSVT